MPTSGSPEGSRRLRFRVLAPLVAVALAGGWALLHGLPDLGGSPDARVRRALAAAGEVVLEDLAGAGQGTRAALRVTYRDAIGAEEQGGRLRAVAVVEAEGTIRGSGLDAVVAVVGREQIPLVPCAAGDCPGPEGPLPRIRGVLEALVARHRALVATGSHRRVVAWQVRVERDTAEVGEDLQTPGPASAPARERTRLRLGRQGGRWAVASP